MRLRAPRAAPAPPAWLPRSLRRVYGAAFSDWVGGTASGDGALALLPALRRAGLARGAGLPALRGALLSAVARFVRGEVRARGGDFELGVLEGSLRWARAWALPFAAEALLGRRCLAALCRARRASAEEAGGSGGSGDNGDDGISFGGAIAALRAAGLAPQAWARLPAGTPLTFTPFPPPAFPEGGGGGWDGTGYSGDEGESDDEGCSDREGGDGCDDGGAGCALRALRALIAALHAGVHACVARARTEQAFELVRDYPESLPALGDLRVCLGVLGEPARARLARCLATALRARLLNLGVATASILSVLLRTVRALQYVEGGAGGAVCALAAEPIRWYLRTRSDAIRCIVASLTDRGSELYEELASGAGSGAPAVAQLGDGDAAAGGGGGEGGSSDEDGVESGAHAPPPPPPPPPPDAMEEGVAVDVEAELRGDGDNDAPTAPGDAPALLLLLQELLAPAAGGARAWAAGGAGGGRGCTPPPPPTPVQWLPELLDADAVRALWDGSGGGGGDRARRGGSNLLTFLLNIYGSPDLFVAAYRSLLCERLVGWGGSVSGGGGGGGKGLPPGGWDVSSEETVVELLKLRFGEGALAASEVMLKDVVDSKRVAVAGRPLLASEGGAPLPARNRARPDAPVDVLITSAHYWPQGFASQNGGAGGGAPAAAPPAPPPAAAPPPPPPTPPGVHPSLAALFSQLAAAYASLKKPRTLVPLWGLGTVDVEVALRGAPAAPFSGTIAQVSLLLAFADVGGARAPLAALNAALRIPPTAALRALNHWVAAGVLRVERGSGGDWEVAAAGEAAGGGGGGAADGCGGAGTGGGVGGGFEEAVAALEGGAEDGDAAEAEAVWCSYVVGMLSNLGALPVDRIHSTLKMFASTGDYPCACPPPPFPPSHTRTRTFGSEVPNLL